LLLVFLLNSYANMNNIQFSLFNHEHLINAAYIYQLIGMVFYTILNFICNKYYTFKK
jgi:putative flippase GtrA